MGSVGALAVWLAAAAACASAPSKKPIPLDKVDSGAGSLAAARKFLEGRWVLESFEVRPPGKAPIHVKASGVLTYDDFGNMHMEISTDQATSDGLRAAGIDIRDGKISTDGRTAIDQQNHTLTYILEGQAPLQATGSGPLSPNRPRHYVVSSDGLTLTTNDDSGKPVSIGKWKRSQ